MSKCSSALQVFDDIEYQRVRHSNPEEIAQKERKYWLFCLIVLIIESALGLVVLFGLILQLYHVFHQQQPVESFRFFALLFSLLNIATLGNGLLGKTHRTVCLLLNLLFFEVIPFVFTVITFFILLLHYKEIQHNLRDFLGHHRDESGEFVERVLNAILVLGIIFMFYRLYAVIVIYRFRSLLRQEQDLKVQERPPL